MNNPQGPHVPGGGIYQLRVPSLPQDQNTQGQQILQQQMNLSNAPTTTYSAQNMMFHPGQGVPGRFNPLMMYGPGQHQQPGMVMGGQQMRGHFPVNPGNFAQFVQQQQRSQNPQSSNHEAKARQEFERQHILERQRQKLQQIGGQGSSRTTATLNPEAMIASIMGPIPSKLTNQQPSKSGHVILAENSDQLAASERQSVIGGSGKENLANTVFSAQSESGTIEQMKTIVNPMDEKPGIDTIMKECADLSLSGSKPKAFHHATLNELRSPTQIASQQQTSGQQDLRATNWTYKQAEQLEGIFVLPAATPAQTARIVHGGYIPHNHPSQQQRHMVPHVQQQQHHNVQPTSGVNPAGGGVPTPPHWPEWMFRDNEIPAELHKLLGMCGNADWPNTGIVYNLLVASGLPRETLGQIWALVNRSYTGQLTKQEFFAAMIFVAIAQEGKLLSHNSIFLLDKTKIPLPKLHLSQQQQPTPSNSEATASQPPAVQQTSVGPVAQSAVTPSSLAQQLIVPEEPRGRSSSEDEFGEFADFRTATQPVASTVATNSVASLAKSSSASGLSTISGSGGLMDMVGGISSGLTGSRGSLTGNSNGATDPFGTLRDISRTDDSSKDLGSAVQTLEPSSLTTIQHFPLNTDLAFMGITFEKKSGGASSNDEYNGSKEPSVRNSMKPFDEDTDKSRNTPVDFGSALPPQTVNLTDKYAAIKEGVMPINEIEDEHISVWMKCLRAAKAFLKEGADLFGKASSSAVCKEVLGTEEGSNYFQSIVEIYRVACRIRFSIKTMTFQTDKLVDLLNDIDINWESLQSFAAGNKEVLPHPSSLQFAAAILSRQNEDEEKQDLCGVCLLNVNKSSGTVPNTDKTAVTGTDKISLSQPGITGKEIDGAKFGKMKLEYAGRQYHSQCANLWVNCIDSLLPALAVPAGLL